MFSILGGGHFEKWVKIIFLIQGFLGAFFGGHWDHQELKTALIGLLAILSRVYCKKGPTHHAYAWQIGSFWQDSLDIWAILTRLLLFKMWWYYNKFDSTKSLGVCYWCVKIPQWRYMEHGLKHFTFYVQKHIVILAMCYNRGLVRDEPLWTPASV